MLPRESHNHPLMPIKPARLGASRLRSKAPWRGRTHAASRPPCAQELAGPAPPSVGKRAAGLWQLIGGGQSRSRDDHVPRVGRWAWAGPGVPPCSRVTPTSTSHVHLACARRRGCARKVCLTGCSPVIQLQPLARPGLRGARSALVTEDRASPSRHCRAPGERHPIAGRAGDPSVRPPSRAPRLRSHEVPRAAPRWHYRLWGSGAFRALRIPQRGQTHS